MVAVWGGGLGRAGTASIMPITSTVNGWYALHFSFAHVKRRSTVQTHLTMLLNPTTASRGLCGTLQQTTWFSVKQVTALLARQQQGLLQPDSLSPVSEGFVGDPWLSIMLTLCHILHSISHWPVLVYLSSHSS
jgi:hypothetical protein